MEKTQVVALFKSLEEQERRHFIKYLNRLYNRSKLIDLAKHLAAETKPEKEGSKKLNRQYIQRNIVDLPLTKKKEKELLNLGSDLKIMLEQYLIFEYMKKKVFLYDYFTARIYLERNLPKQFTTQVKSLKRNRNTYLDKNGIDIPQSHDTMLLNEMMYFDEMEEDAIHKTDYLLKAWENLNEYQLLLKLKFGCELMNRDNILKEGHQISLTAVDKKKLREEINRYKKERAEHSSLFRLYKIVFELLLTKREEFFVEARSLVFSPDSNIAFVERSLVLGYLINMCIHYNAVGKTGYLQILFEICQKGDELDILSNRGRITPTRFHNILNVSYFLHRYDWLRKFLNKYSNHLPTVTEDEAHQLSKAQEAFDKQQYKQVIDLLEQKRFPNIYFKLRAKSLLLRSLYLWDIDTEKILMEGKNFALILKRDKVLSKAINQGCLSFIDIIRKMTLYREKVLLREQRPEDKRSMLEAVKTTDKLQYRHWLKQQIQQL